MRGEGRERKRGEGRERGKAERREQEYNWKLCTFLIPKNKMAPRLVPICSLLCRVK